MQQCDVSYGCFLTLRRTRIFGLKFQLYKTIMAGRHLDAVGGALKLFSPSMM